MIEQVPARRLWHCAYLRDPDCEVKDTLLNQQRTDETICVLDVRVFAPCQHPTTICSPENVALVVRGHDLDSMMARLLSLQLQSETTRPTLQYLMRSAVLHPGALTMCESSTSPFINHTMLDTFREENDRKTIHYDIDGDHTLVQCGEGGECHTGSLVDIRLVLQFHSMSTKRNS